MGDGVQSTGFSEKSSGHSIRRSFDRFRSAALTHNAAIAVASHPQGGAFCNSSRCAVPYNRSSRARVFFNPMPGFASIPVGPAGTAGNPGPLSCTRKSLRVPLCMRPGRITFAFACSYNRGRRRGFM